MSTDSLRPDHHSRPLWITPNGHIIMENFSTLNAIAQEFLTAIAEPVSRPSLMHEYRLTPYSLYAAVSIGLNPVDIISFLDRLCKTPFPLQLENLIKQSTANYGKAKLLLRNGRFWLEAVDIETLQTLLRDDVIREARSGTSVMHESAATDKARLFDDYLAGLLDSEKAETKTDIAYAFEIDASRVESVKKRCIELDYPVLEEYDFKNDTKNPSITIDLRPSVAIRPYQESSLSKMFGNGRARSGIIVLPCGAGKTLVGIIAACSIKKSVLVLCTSAVAAEQWRLQFRQFSTVSDASISKFTSDTKEKFSGSSGIIVSTYTMIAYSGRRSYESKKIMDFVESIEWGLLILDEVHVVPANVFRKVLTSVAAHAKLGLTATLVREDERIDDLNFLIGPKLYEANWQDLSRQGHIASVQVHATCYLKCAEVWCPMPRSFYHEYLAEKSKKRRLLYVMNPRKFQICQFLIAYHEARGDKVIVFSDNVYALKAYALRLRKPYIYGPTSQGERMQVLQQFQANPAVNTLFLSKVGDTSIDLPEATCLIQISSHYGSRRQEAQRLGRILRAKKRSDGGFNAYFYSLVSKDTEEMYYSTKRQQFLVDQGYAFKTITELKDLETLPNLVYASESEQMELLREVLLTTEADADEEQVDDVDAIEDYAYTKSTVSLKEASGVGEMAHFETNRRIQLGRGAKR